MPLSFTKNTLKKLEQVFEEQGFEIRYEKGHFQSGYCLVAQNKIILISRFFNTQARIESLIEILNQVDLDESILTEQSKKVLISLINYNKAA